MNVTVKYPMNCSIPKNLFSRQWYDLWNDIEETNPWFARIRETKKKLEDLETKLRVKLNWYPTGLRTPKEDDPNEDLLIDTILLLNSHVGVWKAMTVDSYPTPMVWDIKMKYPHNNRVMPKWNEDVLGVDIRKNILERISKVCLVMLSPECVEWLNAIDGWITSYTTSTTT